MQKILWIIVVIVLFGLVIWGLVAAVKSDAPQGPDMSTFHPAQNREHVPVGAAHPAHSSSPPSGGWHYALTAKKKFYDEPIPDEYIIHNLEHGDIWITYHPRISTEAKDALKQFAFSKVLISPREANDTDIALVAWERVDKFNLEGGVVPEGRINDFIARYRDKGPEKLPFGAMEQTFN